MEEQSNNTPPEQFPPPLISKSISPEVQASPIIELAPQPRTVTFGSIEVTEDLQADLLTSQERHIYQAGFDMLQALVASTEQEEYSWRTNIEKMVLTNPEMVSGFVGMQPLLSLGTSERVLLRQQFARAGIDFHQGYSFLHYGNLPAKGEEAIELLVNDRAAEQVLRTYQKELGIRIEETPLEKNAILAHVMDVMNSSDVGRTNLAFGLLSGFPLEDVQYAVAQLRLGVVQKVRRDDTLDASTLQELPIKGSGNVLHIDPISLLNPDAYEMRSSRNHYLPATRATLALNATYGSIEGFGLRWGARIPASEATVRHAQKLLQIDREVEQTNGEHGLLNFITHQRSTFNVEDNINVINGQKELLYGSASKVGSAVKTIGASLIFTVAGAILNEVKDAFQPQQTK